MKSGRILVVDDDASMRRVIEFTLAEHYQVRVAENGTQALESLATGPVDLVITDVRMPSMDGMELLRRVRQDFPEVVVILLTAYGSIDAAVEAVKSGAYDYLTKPFNPEELKLVVSKALEHRSVVEENQNLREAVRQIFSFENMIGASPKIRYVFETAARVAKTDSTLLIYGESGTGKELLARAIHLNSRRKDKPFVTINCAAIPPTLIESELFGHLRGAFTGAVAHKRGKMELADGGTLFLDEIAELPPELQVKLLRVVQEGELEKIGSLEPVRVDVRFIAATNRNLKKMIEDATFREDLYYRLAVVPIELPPLRERKEDIPALFEHFFRRCSEERDRPGMRYDSSILPRLMHYNWPGNIRELQNVIERMIVLARGETVGADDLPEPIHSVRPFVGNIWLELPDTGINLEEVERALIHRALEKCDWNQTRAAKFLDISRKTLIYRMEKYGLEPPDEGQAARENQRAQSTQDAS